MSGKLTLVCTPIGNLGDLAPRSQQALTECDFWIVEDSRISGKLQAAFGIKKPMRVLNDHTSQNQVEKYVAELKAGTSACLITDGGAPTVSDPGANIADLCYAANVEVDALPGPSAVTTALALSGFFAQRFAFLGFLGRKPGDIRKELQKFADSSLTLVIFESPNRLDAFISIAESSLGPRRFTVCREISKVHQQVFRGVLPIICSDDAFPRKGEITIVIEGKRKKAPFGYD